MKCADHGCLFLFSYVCRSKRIDSMQLVKLTYGLFIFLVVVIVGCARTGPKSTGAKASVYSEDLSKVRPHYSYVEQKLEKKSTGGSEPIPSKSTTTASSADVTRKLDTLLDTLAEQNKAIKYINGFRIQVYVGNIRSEADAAKSYAYTSFEELMPYVTYSQPTYRVKIGDFMYRSDAEHYLEQVRQQYSTAVILPDRVEIKNSLQVRTATVQK